MTYSVPARAIVRCLVWLAAALLATGALAQPAPGPETTARLIVKFRDVAAMSPATVSATTSTRLARFVEDAGGVGVTMTHLRPMALGAHVMALARPLALAEAEALAARLARNPDVEFVQPDRRRHALLVPNDPFFGQQRYLGTQAGGINATTAWDVTTGSPNVVVAVVDTGYRPHADLAGRILPGYDFITDIPTANDGDGRDADATDPGDWVTQADKDNPHFANSDCGDVASSSWHGTSIAGIVAADSSNGQGVAGIDWKAKILPVRVLGKCGGDDSDILDGVSWAAGLEVQGVPANPNPAQVINLSLGGPGPCDPMYHSVFRAALAHGVTRAIVVAAGNDSADVSGTAPANCSEAIAVAATTNQGRLADYSNFGTGVALSAPGGSDASLNSDYIFVLWNAGTQSPAEDAFAISAGTSNAAPIVSGVASLVLGLAPNTTADQLRSILVSTASPFPAGSDCAPGKCGAGIVNAHGAVVAAGGAAPPTPDLNQHGLTGSWYEPATSGQGFELEVYPNHLAPGTGLAQVSWFTFDTVVGGAERQRWYTLQGPAVSGQSTSTLTIYQNTGGNFNAPPITNPNPVGTATLSFDSCISGVLTYNFTDGSGRTGSIPLTRLAGNVTCSTTSARPTNADFGFSGNWYDLNTSGQGFTVEVNPISGVVYFAWYTYVPNGAGAGAAGQRWYTGRADGIAPGTRSFPVQIRETTGGKFDAPTVPEPDTVPVGNGRLTFQSCTSATFNYNFAGGTSSGLSGTITLSRVGPVPPGCTF